MEQYILSGIALGLVGLVWFVIRDMISKQGVRMDEHERETEKKFERSNGVREDLKDLYMRHDYHKMFCEKTQSKFLLATTEAVTKTKDELMKEIRSNKDAVTMLIGELRKDMRKNGYIK